MCLVISYEKALSVWIWEEQRVEFTVTQRDTSEGQRLSSKWVTVLLSAGVLRFRGAGFLKGSAPPAFAHA